MSWAAEDWTSGLSGPVLQKVQELQRQQERLGRERQQRQLQLDNADAALNKQRVKNEELRAKLVAVQREMAAVQDVAQSESRARERLAQELQVKQAQVCSLEGQVESARTQMNTLMQQVKRLEQELEKLQSGNVSGDSMLFSTPCWNMASPWENSDCSTDDKKMTRGGRESRMLPVRQQLQFDNFSPKPTGPQHSRQTSPPHQSAHQADAFTPSSVFPWERNDKLDLRRREASQPCVSNVVSRDQPTEGFGTEEGLKKERDALKSANRTLQTRVQTLEKDVQAESDRFRDVEGRLSDVQRELASRDQSLNRTRDELGRANTSLSQERDRLQLSDQRVKQLQEELKCQRQNAESSRCTAEQRRREMEREHQREVQELQKERQAVDRLHQQESFKLNQEIQQARTQYNTLQSQFDKLSLQKQALERDLENLNQKLRNTESQLQDSQKRDAQTQSKLMEALRERDGLAVTVEQLKRKEKSWQEEIKRLEEELAEALKLLKELQERGPVPLPSAPLEFMLTGSLQHNHQISHQQSVQKKRPIKSDRLKEDNVLPKFPSDREPGEGMDSENITEQTFFSSEETLKTKGRGPKLRVDEVGIAVDSKSAPPDEDPVSHVVQVVGKQENKECVIEDEDRNPSTTVKPCSSDLERENSVLVDELRDMKLELQRRLDDLEAQRRSEAEARTKLKQLSRKYASQSEQLRQKAQEQQKLLEEEKLETGRLKESLDALDKDRQNKEEEKMELNRLKENMEEMERKEREMEEHRNQLMESLEALKVEMTQEREKGMEEEQEEKKNLVARVTDLEAQLEELQSRLKENVSLNCEERKARVPTLCEEIFVPVKRIGFCQAENILNATVSQEHTVRDLITDFETAECKEPSGPYLKDSTGSGVQQELEILKELCETLQNERDVEASKAKSFQNRLDVLQKQVTSQTQQLTQAFESQSCHIEGLLHELNERDHLLQRQGEELHLCREKIAQLEAKNLQEDKRGNDGSANAEVSSQESDQSKKSVLHEDLTSANLLQDEVTISTNANAEDLLLDGTIQAEQAALKINASCNLTEDVRAYETVPADLCELKIQNDQLFKEMQSVIRENEDLRWRLKWLETQDPTAKDGSVPPQTEDRQSLTVAGSSVENFDKVRAGQGSGLNISLMEQLRLLQSELQHLNEENRRQAEEIALWRTASQETPASLGEQLSGDGSSVVLMREDQIMLDCRSNKLTQWSVQTRSVILQSSDLKTHGPSTDETLTQPDATQHPQSGDASCTSIRSDDPLLSKEGALGEDKNTTKEAKELNTKDNEKSPLNRRGTNIDMAGDKTCEHYSCPGDIQDMAQNSPQLNTKAVCFSVIDHQSQSFTESSHELGSQDEKVSCAKTLPGGFRSSNTDDRSKFKSPAGDSVIIRDVVTSGTQTEEPPQSYESGHQNLIFCHSGTQTEEERDKEYVDLGDSAESRSFSPVKVFESDKLLFSGSFPIPANPVHLAERIRRNRSRMSVAYDDTEYEPYGLPEVVMKGFADIPTGPACPYVLRRGLLGTAAVPLPLHEEETMDPD